MRSTLVHEMIHAWQDEYDPAQYNDWRKLNGHSPAFIKNVKNLMQNLNSHIL